MIHSSFIRTIVEDPEHPGEMLLDLGEEICKHLGWQEGDKLKWTDNKDGTWTVRKKEDPKYYNINEILDCQDENTVDYTDARSDQASHPLFGAIPPAFGPISSSQASNYSNVTVTSGGYTLGTGVGTTWAAPIHTNATSKITLDGAEADIIVNGKSLVDTLMALEERLNILVPNPELEAEWAELQALGNQYRELEQQINDKMKTWKLLNK